MDSFELNKIAGAVLFTLLIYLGVRNLGDILFDVEAPNPDSYIVEGVETDDAAIASAEPEVEVPISELLLTASVDKGMKVAKKCAACHEFAQGAANKVGPALWGVVGRDIGSHAGFVYSGALSGLEGNWTAEKLNGFLENPKKYAEGTSMAFAGLRKPSDRADVIAYLQSLSN